MRGKASEMDGERERERESESERWEVIKIDSNKRLQDVPEMFWL
jgi:hypothetical protein